jgi:branched-chain amino acid transport system ATP-binding protein
MTAAAHESLLELAGVRAGYGTSEVLFGIDLALARGEIVGVLGRHGMG